MYTGGKPAGIYGFDGSAWVKTFDPEEAYILSLATYAGYLYAGTAEEGRIYGPCEIIIDIDIKPGSYPNSFNNNGHGVIPVAILGGADFDVNQIDPATVSLEGLAIHAVGKSNKLLAHIEDVNSDGIDDLVYQIEDSDGVFEVGTTIAPVTGNLYDGTAFMGTDEITIFQVVEL